MAVPNSGPAEEKKKKGGFDLASIGGLSMGLLAILGGNYLEGGHLSSLTQPTAAIIVLGGTFGATLLSFPLKTVKAALKGVRRVFMNSEGDLQSLLQKLVLFAHKARKDGMVSLEAVAQAEPDPFLRKLLTMAVDGTDPKTLEDAMLLELDNLTEEEEESAKVFEAAGGYSPTIGILGAVLGLIHVMQNLTDPGKLGSGIAVAFVATVYGVGLANLVFLPIAGKLKTKIKADMLAKQLLLEGINSIQHGENPRLIEQKLMGFLNQEEREAYKKATQTQSKQKAAA